MTRNNMNTVSRRGFGAGSLVIHRCDVCMGQKSFKLNTFVFLVV